MTPNTIQLQKKEEENGKSASHKKKYINIRNIYRIQDIPKDFSTNRVKGALKPYGKVIEINTIFNKNPKQDKEMQVTIEKTKNSIDLNELWSIPIGSIMARVALEEDCPEIWLARKQYMARLYGIPKHTNTVLLMKAIKNVRPKTCHIPKNSKTGKERRFTTISFQSKKDLNQACVSVARYYNSVLTWSISRTRHL